MKHVIIYTDGACSGNPGPGGWGALLIYGESRKTLGGGEKQTTNNRMEITAAIKALEALKEPCAVDLYSDSAYLVDAHEKHWLDAWQKNNWKRKHTGALTSNENAKGTEAKSEATDTVSGKQVLNVDLWQRLLELENKHVVRWHKVAGHAGVAENEICDQIAVEQTRLFKNA